MNDIGIQVGHLDLDAVIMACRSDEIGFIDHKLRKTGIGRNLQAQDQISITGRRIFDLGP